VRFAALKIRYIASMINGCKHGISGETSGSKRLSMSGSRAFSSLLFCEKGKDEVNSTLSLDYEFYQKQGYVIVGVMPDANGLGKPDILMAKSVVR
jgi:hypothetical protein